MGLGAFETEEACRAWKEEYELEFPVLPDGDGALFRTFTNGWVPWSVLVNLYDSEGCAQIHAALQDFREGVIGILITSMPYKCPAAPY